MSMDRLCDSVLAGNHGKGESDPLKDAVAAIVDVFDIVLDHSEEPEVLEAIRNGKFSEHLTVLAAYLDTDVNLPIQAWDSGFQTAMMWISLHSDKEILELRKRLGSDELNGILYMFYVQFLASLKMARINAWDYIMNATKIPHYQISKMVDYIEKMLVAKDLDELALKRMGVKHDPTEMN